MNKYFRVEIRVLWGE